LENTRLLGRRLISTAVIVGVMLVLTWLDFQIGAPEWLGRPGLLLGLFAIVVSGMAASELTKLLQDDQNPLNSVLAVVAVMAMVSTDCLRMLWIEVPAFCPFGTLGWAIAGLVVAVFIVFGAEMIRYGEEERGRVLNRLCRYLFMFAYLQIFFAFLIAHRLLELDNAFGLFALILPMATVKLSDGMAYFAGKSLGRIKIAPKLSPKKTLEGVFG
jgi:CDP-diglyceride synthetase